MLSELNRKVINLFAEKDMRIPETAEALSCHRNTVIYHLEQIKKQTGLDPRKFYDLLQLLQKVENAPMQQWIPVTERMPDHPIRLDWSDDVLFEDDLKEEYKSYPVLVYDGEFHIAEHYMTESVWLEKDGDGCLENVTHWATPEPPEVTA